MNSLEEIKNMNDAISLAIEKGGYETTELMKMEALAGNVMPRHAMLLDPLFWQALGRALGWKDEIAYSPFKPRIGEWLYHWHRFIDWIAEGKDIDKFFEDLIK